MYYLVISWLWLISRVIYYWIKFVVYCELEYFPSSIFCCTYLSFSKRHSQYYHYYLDLVAFHLYYSWSQLYLFFMYLMWIDCSVDSICIVVSSDMSSGYISSVFRFEWFYLQYILSQCLFLCFLSAFHLYYSSTFCILSEYFWRLSTKCFNVIIDAFCMLPLEVYWKI